MRNETSTAARRAVYRAPPIRLRCSSSRWGWTIWVIAHICSFHPDMGLINNVGVSHLERLARARISPCASGAVRGVAGSDKAFVNNADDMAISYANW
ncbi:MAG: hypothetical protein ACLT98_02935 [Eggerthellaceae bacterium]